MKEYTVEEIREKITTDDRWATRALLALYKMQTDNEQLEKNTNVTNGVGFNKFDSEFMSSLAQWYSDKGFLTAGQLVHLKRKIGKYARQLQRLAARSA